MRMHYDVLRTMNGTTTNNAFLGDDENKNIPSNHKEPFANHYQTELIFLNNIYKEKQGERRTEKSRREK